MNTLLLEHFAAVSKIAAYRQSRERQAGVNCTKGYLQSQDAELFFEGPRTLECFFKYIPSDKIQVIAGFSISMIEIYALTTNQLRVYCGGGNATVDIVPGDSYLVDVAYDGTTAICYLNGTEAARFPVTGYKITDLFRIGSNTYIPQGSLVFCRHYNYAISAEEAAAHYNDGDPSGYVLPGTMKGLTPVEIISENSHTWTGVDDPVYLYAVGCSRYFKIGELCKMCVTISDYEAGERPFFKISTADTTVLSGFNGNGTYELYLQVKGTPYQSVFVYAGPIGTDRRMTITVDSIESVGCVAEYLPQNLTLVDIDKPDKTIVPDLMNDGKGWLDSAKQLPLNDEYLPPLLESINGYDLAANGTPEIVYKPE